MMRKVLKVIALALFAILAIAIAIAVMWGTFPATARAQTEVVACTRQPATDYLQPTGFKGRWFGSSETLQWRLWEGQQVILSGKGEYDIVRIFLWNVWYRLEHEVAEGQWHISGECNYRYEQLYAPASVSVLVGNSVGTISDAYVEVPIHIQSDVTGKGIIAYQFNVSIDNSNVIQPTYVRVDNTLSSSMNPVYNQTSSSTLAVAIYGTQELTGQGILVWIGFLVKGQGTANVELQNFMFNEGTPEVAGQFQSTVTISGLALNGTVKHWNSSPVPGTDVFLEGASGSQRQTTDANGYYEFGNLTRGNYSTAYSRQADESDLNSITAFDAARTAQCAAGKYSCQPIAADVSGDGQITGYDASLIARFAAGNPVQGTALGIWEFRPAVTMINLDSSKTINVKGYLIGDVSGNWGSTAFAASGTQVTVNYSVNGNGALLSLEASDPFISAEMVFDHEVVSANADGFEVVTNNSKVVMFRTDEVTEAALHVEFATENPEMDLISVVIDEQNVMADIPLQPTPILRMFLPSLNR